jgi:hypothetical protein
MMGANYAKKKDLKASVGKALRFTETSWFGAEYQGDGTYTMVGPCAYTNRKWYARVTVADGVIAKVE